MNWYDAANKYYCRVEDYWGLNSILTEWQRELVALMLVNREVNNGGYLQFFVNHGMDGYSYACQSFRAIGANQMAKIIDSCQSLINEHLDKDIKLQADRSRLLPNQIIGKNGKILKEPGSDLPESVLVSLSNLSWKFMNYPDNVEELAQNHYGPMIEKENGQ